MSVNLTMTNLDFGDPNLQGLFGTLQGNILKSHGRDRSRHVFIRFTGAPADVREWVAKFGRSVTTAAAQRAQTLQYRRTGEQSLFTGFLLTPSGYAALGVPQDQWPDDKAFRAGMKDTAIEYDTRPRDVHAPAANPLADNPATWEEPFRQQIDAMAMLAYGRPGEAADADSFLDGEIGRLTASLSGVGEIVCIQRGHVIRNDSGQVIEHFGNPDGVSNPQFMRPDLDKVRRENGGFDRYDGSAPLNLVLAKDPFPGVNEYGTYYVYRKLQQNIRGYQRKCAELASLMTAATVEFRRNANDGRGEQELYPMTFDADYANALFIGRFKDGTPISEQSVPGWSSLPNNFNFDADIRGRKCPFASHIRKTNPRLDTAREFGAPGTVERSRRIVRRGISYGSEDLHPDDEWTDAGLLFLSVQSNIEYQFIFIQHAWCNNEIFVEQGTGLDPICGVPLHGTPKVRQKWPLRWGLPHGSVAGGATGSEEDVEFAMNDVVRMRGGEYFFAPSRNFLLSLAG